MKKLLSILCSTVVVLSTGTSVIACANSSSNNNVVTGKTDLSVVNQDSIDKNLFAQPGGWKNITFGTLKVVAVQRLSDALYGGDQTKLDVNTDFKNISFYYSSNNHQISYNPTDTLSSDKTLLADNSINIVFQASNTSTNIINETPKIKFTFNSFSSDDILNSAVNYFNSNDFQTVLTRHFFATNDQTVTVQDLSNYLISKENIDNFIKAIVADNPHKYLNFDTANFKISPCQGAKDQKITIADKTIKLQFSYEGAVKEESIDINWNFDSIIQERINSAIKQKSFLMNTDFATASSVSTDGSKLASAIVNYINTNILSDISVDYHLKSAVDITGLGYNKGTSGFSISMDFLDNDGKTISSNKINNGNQSNGQDIPFKFKVSTDLVNSFINLGNDFNKIVNPSLSLQDLPIGDVIPVTDLPFSKDVSSATRSAITTLFQDRTLGNFLQDFVEVDNSQGAGLANDLDKVTDISQLFLTDNGQDFKPGTPYYEYFDVGIRNFFKGLFQKESGQTIDPGLNTFVFSGKMKITLDNSAAKSTTLDYNLDLWNLLKDIAPDIVHFHWFIRDYIEKTKDNNPNYVILLMKYLLDTPRNYLTGLKSGKTDNFTSLIPSGTVNNNLDNLLNDVLDGFKTPNATMQVKGFVGSMYLIATYTLDYPDLVKMGDPAKQIIDSLNSILSPTEGFDVFSGKTSVQLNAAIDTWMGQYQGHITMNLDLTSLHKLEIKKFISDNEAPGGYFADISGLDLNKIEISILKDQESPDATNKLFLKGTGTDSATQKPWSGDVHNLSDLITHNINFMEFDFRNLELEFSYNGSSQTKNLFIDPNIIPDFYLTF